MDLVRFESRGRGDGSGWLRAGAEEMDQVWLIVGAEDMDLVWFESRGRGDGSGMV